MADLYEDEKCEGEKETLFSRVHAPVAQIYSEALDDGDHGASMDLTSCYEDGRGVAKY